MIPASLTITVSSFLPPRFTGTALLALFSLAVVLLLPDRTTAQQATLTDDAQTSAAAPNQNFGTNVSVRVSGTNIRGFFKFKLTPNLPPGTTGSRIGKATLKLFVGGVTTPGTFDVFRVTGAWNEATVTGNTAPPLGALESAISVNATQTNQWVTLDVTQLIKDWLDGVLPNEGIALVANGGVGNVIFNSKENQTTSHESGLEIVLNHAATADRATQADNADTASTAITANSLATSAVVPGSQVSGDIAGKASSITGTIAGSQVSGPVAEATHATNADIANTATNANSVTTPLTLISADPTYTLSVGNTGAGRAITASGDINTSTQYYIGGVRVLSIAGTQNTLVGVRAGQAITTGVNNAFVGLNAGMNNADANNNAFFGTFAGQANTTGSLNSFFGTSAGLSNLTAGNNSFFGTSTGRDNTTGSQNSFFGASAGEANTTGADNSFFGWTAGRANVTGSTNSFFGTLAGLANTTGNGNSFFGHSAGMSNSFGSANVFFGNSAGSHHTTGNFNTFVGINAGRSNISEGDNTFIGANADGAPGVNNATAIGARAQVTQSNSLVLGSISGINGATADTNVGVGTTSPTEKLHVNGNIRITGENNGLIFSDGTMISTAPSSSGATASDLNCTSCVSESELSFDPVTQAALDAHKISGDHDARYSLLGHIHNVSEISNAATLGANSFGGSQSVAGNVSVSGTVSGAGGSFQTNVTIGNSSTGGGITLTNTVNRFAELGSNVGFDSVAGTVVGLRLKSTHPLENYSYGIFHGSNVWPGALVFRKDDESISPGDARNRLIIADNGDIIVGPGSLGVGTPSPAARLDVVGDARASGNVTAASFTGDGSGLTNVSASSSTSLSCASCVSESELDFNPATQAELDAHKSSADERYVLKTGGTMTGALNLPANGLNVGGSQLVLVGGNVGIGTVSPGAPLEVEGITRLRNLIATPQDAGLEGGEVSLQGAPTFHSWQMDNYGGNFRLHNQGVSRLELTPAGDVGLGTASPTQKLEVVGNVRINGNFVATGSKSAVVTLPDNREVALYAVESPGNWFEDFGHATLRNGVAHVEIDSTFVQTINTEMTYHVFLTPNGDCKGLYVARKTATSFEVRELGGGQTNVTFDYRIVARRKGYENVTSRTR